MKNLFSIFSASLYLMLSLFCGCAGENSSVKQESAQNAKEITFAYVNWAESVAMTYLAKSVLEAKGYDVKLFQGSATEVFSALSNGDADVFLDVWLPKTHQHLVDQFKNDINPVGQTVANTKTGFVVPAYMEHVNSIADLDSVAEQFGGMIVGIDESSGLMEKARQAIATYQLKINLVPTDGKRMVSRLRNAVQQEEPIVVTLWRPHYIFADTKLKFLKDPLNVFGEGESIYVYEHRKFSEADPILNRFLKNFKLTNTELSRLMEAFEDKKEDPEMSAKKWVEANKILVNSWFN
ncbi:glycine betaine ABC transporter substrate-binding protein [Persicobacter psychrovividus]|uniref:Glycine/betaine ABC transporter n=1 Tax=Persicobacter psychrovividus TaxID=387638 RepID=A0ABM7VDH7_9BACT|nr:glycine/betaine ABC transporter [Persicobacter psychrovividus]